MRVINFRSRIGLEEVDLLSEKVGQPLDFGSYLGLNTLFIPEEVESSLDNVGFSPEDWKRNDFVLWLPSEEPTAALVLACVFRRTGTFPKILIRYGGSPVWIEDLGKVANPDTLAARPRNARSF